MLKQVFLNHKRAGLLALIAHLSPRVDADWRVKMDNSVHYTDDVALFSVSKRLSLKDDPTQPMVDRPSQGGDFVYEPGAELEWLGHNVYGEIKASLQAGAYIFIDQPAYTHGLYELQLSQTLAATDTQISLHYNAIPELFLGKNAIKQANGTETEYDEQLSNHFWSVHIDQPLTKRVTVRLLGRYGLRNYNAPFLHRDTQFWTIGSHLEWAIHPDIALLLGYHYEQGATDHQKAQQVADDVSYINHYVSAELKIHLWNRLSALFIFDYENNAFTSNHVNDEHYHSSETVYQGEIELLYDINAATALKLGWQHGNRKLTSETQSVNNTNVWLGLEYAF